MRFSEYFKDPVVVGLLFFSIILGIFCYSVYYSIYGQKYYNKCYLACGECGVRQTHKFYEDKLCQIEGTPLYYKVKLKNINDIDTLEILIFSEEVLEKK